MKYLLCLLVLGTFSCRQIWGDNDLGNNFTLLEGDKLQDRVIMYCTGRSYGACLAGTYIVPEYSRHMDTNGKYAEYVEVAKANDKFIIARSLQLRNSKKNYWIVSKNFKIENCDRLDCDSIIQSHVIGPMEYPHFQTKLSELNIDLDFDKD